MADTHPAIAKMLERYDLGTEEGVFEALREILQEIVLLGLHDAGFFEKAVFYGGTALRILYGLPRFSEDLDFSLIRKDPGFNLQDYEASVKETLTSFGFEVDITVKPKESQVKHLLVINAPQDIAEHFHTEKLVKIKFEVDTEPPGDFESEKKLLLTPRPFMVHSMTPSSLFAGKMHALLCRKWVNRPKGRDWYDLVWYVSRQTPLDVKHLQARLQQSCKWKDETPLELPETVDESFVIDLLKERIKTLDIPAARNDVGRFIADKKELNLWSEAFFMAIAEQIRFV